MSQPITNKSNYWSQHHYGMLIMLAKQVLDQFGGQFEINELINMGWFRQARYYENVKGKAVGIRREMYKWACKQRSSIASIDDIDDESVVLRF